MWEVSKFSSPSYDEVATLKKARLMTTIASRVERNVENRLTRDDVIDPRRELEMILGQVGLAASASGGTIGFTGRDPIIGSPLALATMASAGLMSKAVAIADLWQFRGGEPQDLSVDLRQVLHRLCPFYDKKWELLNGYPPGNPADPTSPFMPNSMYRTKDERWIQVINFYPRLKTATLAFLGCNDDPRAIGEAVRKWNGFELEAAMVSAGLQATVIRTPGEFLHCEQYSYLKEMPLVEVVKIGDSRPEPFHRNPRYPLDGVRALGLGHVIAGSGLGRALAYHGADVLNVWRPLDFELDQIYYCANVGMRSSTLEIAAPDGAKKFRELLGTSDIFFSNRRPGYLEKFRLTSSDAADIRPGIVHVSMSLYGAHGPWANRIGFDQNAGGATGVLSLEGSIENPKLPEIFVVNDYVMSWLAAVGAITALKRRAVEGGSYRVTVSLTRLSLWLMEIGIFDKAYACRVAGTSGEHEYLAPDVFGADTPCGYYQGVTDQVSMSRTPGHYSVPLVPRGASRPEWLPRNG